MPDGTRLLLLAPIVRGRKGEYRKELQELRKKGFQRVKIDGAFYEIAEAPALDKKFKHDIDVVVDRLVVRADLGPRLADSFETALKLADGLAVVELADSRTASPPPLALSSPPPERGRSTAKRSGGGRRYIAMTPTLTLPLSGGGKEHVIHLGQDR
jgi:excinuclease ABC subunit A